MEAETSEKKYRRIQADLLRASVARTRQEDDIAHILKKLAESLQPEQFVEVMNSGVLPAKTPLTERQRAIFQRSTEWLKHLDNSKVVVVEGLGGYCDCTD